MAEEPSPQNAPYAGGGAPVPATAATPAAAAGQGGRALAEQYLQRGLNHYDRQEVEAALGAYQQCVRADPTFALGHNNLGMVLIDLERYEEAVAELYEAIRCDPTYAESYSNLGFVLRRMQRSVAAASAYERFLALEPDVEEGPRIRGWVDTVLQESNLAAIPPLVLPLAPGGATAPAKAPPPVPAVAAAPAGPAQAPAPQPAAPAQAEAPAKIKKLSGWELPPEPAPAAPAPPAAPAGAAQAPAPQPAAPAQAEAPPKIKRLSGWELPPEPAPVAAAPPAAPPAAPQAAQAAAAPVPAAAAPPAPATADVTEVIERGMDEFAEGNFTEAAAIFQQAVDQAPDNAEGYVGLARVWVRQEKVNEAIGILQKAVELDPDDPAGFYVLGFALRAMEQNIEAAEAYERFLQLMPGAADGPRMQEWITHVKTLAGRASGVYEEVVEDEEQIVTELDKKYKAALTKFQEGDADTALRDCIKILQEDAGHIRSRVLLGRTYLRQKAYDNAVEQLEAALVTRPDYPEALYFLGQSSEKRGLQDKVLASYRRYLEVAPNGPRAERLRDWLIAHGAPETPAGDARQAQCELCLRFFPENEITQHEGQATCRACLSVMGGAPSLMASELAAAAEGRPGSVPASVAVEEPRRRRSKGLALVGAMAGLAAAVAALCYLGILNPNPLLEKLGLRKPPKPKPIPNHVPPPPPVLVFDATKARIANEPASLVVRPFAPWKYKAELEGLDNLDQVAPGWKKRFSLKNGPQGMAVAEDAGTAEWTPEFTDFETLKKGVRFQVEVAAQGVGKDAGGTEKEFFSVSKSFTLSCQFGYELGPEVDAGLEPNERVAIGVGEFNGDGLADAVICCGRFRAGAVRLYLQRKTNPLPPALELDKGTRFSALCIGELDGVKGQDLLAADWQRGRLKAFFQGEQGLVAGGELEAGPGPVAVGIASPEDDRRAEVAALSGISGQLTVASLTADRKFGPATVIPTGGGGATGFVLPWTSPELGRGFLAIAPLAPSPLVFVPCNKGKWDKGEHRVESSSVEGEGCILAAAGASGPNGSRRLGLVTSTGKESRLVLLGEKGGKFTAVGKAVTLPGLGLGLLAHDFNQDGQDDFVVVMLEECGFYFAQGANLRPGSRIAATTRLLGPVAKFSMGHEEKPDLLLINENRKAQLAKAVEPPPPAPAGEARKEAPAADAKADTKADAKTDVKADTKADAKADVKADTKADAKADVKADTKR